MITGNDIKVVVRDGQLWVVRRDEPMTLDNADDVEVDGVISVECKYEPFELVVSTIKAYVRYHT